MNYLSEKQKKKKCEVIFINWLNIPEDIENYQGFVYIITNLKNGKYYIGKKNFWRIEKRKSLKGNKNKRHRRVETDWKDYYGSSNKLLIDIEELKKDNFKREILILCASKFDLAYKEIKLQIDKGVLFDTNSYNEIINCRLRKVLKVGKPL